MKHIIISIVISSLILLSCEKDETQVMLKSDLAAPVLTSQVDGFTQTITETNLTEKISFKWNESDYGVDTEVSYSLQADIAGGDFTEPLVLGITPFDAITLTLAELNDKLIGGLGLTPNKETPVQLRLISSMNKKYELISKVLTVKITPYGAKKPAILWIPGGYQASGGDPSKPDALTLYTLSGADSLKVYEGYITIPKSSWIKFSMSPDWGGTNYGTSGGNVLSSAGDAGGIDIATPGYYRIRVDVANLKYAVTKITTWGIIGSSITGNGDGWNNSIPMVYDEVKKTWSLKVDLFSGALKLRANNGWDVNYGTFDVNSYSNRLKFDADAITISAAGNYTIVADFSRMKPPFEFTYTITKN